MADLDEMYESVARINLRDQIPVLIEATKETILLLNRGQMYELNIDGSGKPIRPAYKSEWYESLKRRMNPNLGEFQVDLYYSGAFYNARDVTASKTEYIIFSNDSKAEALLEKYGEKILELTEENETVYARGALLENIKLYIEAVSLLKFTE